jgi:hypothetical protein
MKLFFALIIASVFLFSSCKQPGSSKTSHDVGVLYVDNSGNNNLLKIKNKKSETYILFEENFLEIELEKDLDGDGYLDYLISVNHNGNLIIGNKQQ